MKLKNKSSLSQIKNYSRKKKTLNKKLEKKKNKNEKLYKPQIYLKLLKLKKSQPLPLHNIRKKINHFYDSED